MIGFTSAAADLKATVSGLTTRIVLATAFGAAALLVILVTLWFLGDALLTLLQEHGFRRSAAAGLTGIAGLVLAAILGVLAKISMRPRARTLPAASLPLQPRTSTGSVMNDLAVGLGGYAAEQVGSTVRAHPYRTMGTALAAGLALGAIPELRKALFDLTKR
ncbi:MAG TPA: hypothetical protein VFC56_01380 [Stellaceae bacterium]|nr:hypothetical protein [Stellaceae bacterium]